MASSTAHADRRRRVLNDESLCAIAARSPKGAAEPSQSAGDAPRYSAQANIENHPQVTDFVPRRYRTIVLLAGLGVMTAAVAETIAYGSASLERMLQIVSAVEIKSVFSDGLVAWSSAVLLLLIATYARVVYSIRRHRVQDYRGKYRVWRLVVAAAVVLSLNTVVAGHDLAARLAAHFTGWQLLGSNALWWLAPAALLGGWLTVKLIRELAECRTALVAMLLAVTCSAAAGAGSLGWTPAWLAATPDLLGRSMPLVGLSLLLASCLLYARYLVLDVQGLIEHRAEPQRATAATPTPREPAAPSVAMAPVDEPDESTQWVDGSQSAAGEHQKQPRLSKAQRKRLRKQKAQHRAA